MPPSKQTLVVAGLEVNVFSDLSSKDASVPVAVCFLLHGRLSSTSAVEKVARSLIELTREGPINTGQLQRSLLVVTFDQRNHGTRLMSAQANDGWSKGSGNNDRHAIDMYSIQTGTAKDVSFLIDFLPAYLYPSAEQVISTWGVAGISLGGHAAWISLSAEPRVHFGIPIIGCPDFFKLMSVRAAKYSKPFAPPFVPDSLMAYIRQHDPSNLPYHTSNISNPFLGKKILVLSGGIDTLVPWTASQAFVERLEVGQSGVKKVVVVPDAGHECTAAMVAEAAQFLETEILTI